MKYKLMAPKGKRKDAILNIEAHASSGEERWNRGGNEPAPIFDWDSRCLLFLGFSQSSINVCNIVLGKDLSNLKGPNPVLMVVHFNDTLISLFIDPAKEQLV